MFFVCLSQRPGSLVSVTFRSLRMKSTAGSREKLWICSETRWGADIWMNMNTDLFILSVCVQIIRHYKENSTRPVTVIMLLIYCKHFINLPIYVHELDQFCWLWYCQCVSLQFCKEISWVFFVGIKEGKNDSSIVFAIIFSRVQRPVKVVTVSGLTLTCRYIKHIFKE